MLPMGFILDDIILFSTTPLGFIAAASSLIYFENMIIKSIAKDPNRIKLITITDYLKNYNFKDVSLFSPQWAALDAISNKKNICLEEISNSIGSTVSDTKRLVSNLVDGGYIMSKVDIRNKPALCYSAFNKYKI